MFGICVLLLALAWAWFWATLRYKAIAALRGGTMAVGLLSDAIR